jgi:hypothetical protein
LPAAAVRSSSDQSFKENEKRKAKDGDAQEGADKEDAMHAQRLARWGSRHDAII